MASSALGSQSIALLQLPSGTLIDFAGTVEPSGWLLCDGRELLKTSPTYASLFAAIGVAYGETNGSGGAGTTHFRLPDFRGRFARYNDNMGTAQGAASRDTGRVHGTDQTQATSKNGLALGGTTTFATSDHAHTLPFGVAFSNASIGVRTAQSYAGNVTGSTTAGASPLVGNLTRTTGVISIANSDTNTSTASVSLGNGDTETRPINLACNKLIKI